MADDTGVWVKLPTATSTTGGGIYAKVADDGGKWVEIGASSGGGGGGLSWGDFTTNGDETTSDTWGPDSQGRMWKYAEWDAANDYSVNLTGGLYWVLAVGGGNAGGAAGATGQGQPGLVNEGLWELGPGTHIVTVGHKGANNTDATPSQMGAPSSVGDYGTQGYVSWGQQSTGRGAKLQVDPTGYVSSITGDPLEYATGSTGIDRPGRSSYESNTQNDGCLIIATAAPNAKALNWVHTTYHAEVSDGVVTAVHSQKHYADGTTTPLPASELIDATYGVSAGWLFVDGELQPPPPPPEPTLEERIAALKAQIKDLQKDK